MEIENRAFSDMVNCRTQETEEIEEIKISSRSRSSFDIKPLNDADVNSHPSANVNNLDWNMQHSYLERASSESNVSLSHRREDTMYRANVMATEMLGKRRRPSIRPLLNSESDAENQDSSSDLQTKQDNQETFKKEDEQKRSESNCQIEEEEDLQDVFEEGDTVVEDISCSPEDIVTTETNIDTIHIDNTDLRVDYSCLRTPSPQPFTQIENHQIQDSDRFNNNYYSSNNNHEWKVRDIESTPCSNSSRPGSVGWKPVMPGYKDSGDKSYVIKSTIEVNTYDGSLRDAIPSMPKLLAILCLVLNVVVPGIGTFVAGVSVLCCSSIRGGGDKISVIWINSCVMLLQIITTPLFLLGWVWSILWGLSFLAFAESNYCCCCCAKTPKGDNDNDTNTSEISNSDSTGGHYQRQPSATTTTVRTVVEIPERNNHTPTREAAVHSRQSQIITTQLHQEQPIILLQEAPVILTSEHLHLHRQDEFQQYSGIRRQVISNNPRHQRLVNRRHTTGDIQSMLLNPAALENIITRNGVVPSAFRTPEYYMHDEISEEGGSPKL